ncbi:polysaccharide biosynthesis protein [Candidatus Pelagibacter sp. HIMB1748]|uniref:polysaccharide biosynthesis protein n=1 Tax=unclassified Candidatus Pelagibacter TaxID=2647897 RepID=UPI003F86375B
MTLNYLHLEEKIISRNNRFSLNLNQKKELKKIFNNQNVLVFGAAGSIGSCFVLNILKYKIKNLYLVDKNENELVELNRNIVSENLNININYICNDINEFKLNKFLNDKKINIFLNFAAIKHVRSEENIYTLKYLFNTNCNNCFNFNYSKFLKKVFFISTDKACDPSSIMGVSKKIMEQKLFIKKRSIRNVFFSTVRFANVSFSNGSILKMIDDKIKLNKNFGIPLNIKRFFITHNEAVSLCLKSLTKDADGMIVIPNGKILGRQLSIKELLIKILNYYKIKNKSYKNYILTKKFKIKLLKSKITGQKNEETLYINSELNYIKNLDKNTLLLNPKTSKIIADILKKLKFDKKIITIKKQLSKHFNKINLKEKSVNISKNL